VGGVRGHVSGRQLLYDLKNRFVSIGFGQESCANRQAFFGQAAMPGDDEKSDWRPSVPNVLCELDPIHRTRHVHVSEEQNYVVARFQKQYCLAGISGLKCLKARILEHVCGSHSDQWLVFDNKNNLGHDVS